MEPPLLLQPIDPALPEAEKQQRLHQLQQHINNLINNDFNGLVQLLYTVDVDEQKLKHLLQQGSGRDAAPLIAHLIWTRLEEKNRSRQQVLKPPPPDDAERW